MLMRKILSVALALSICAVMGLEFEGCKDKRIPRIPIEYGESGRLLELSYAFGSYHYGSWDYKIYRVVYESQNKEQLFFRAIGGNGVDLNVLSQIEEYVLDDIYLLIEQNDIFSWNGFRGDNPDVLDGYGFYLTCTFENMTLTAGGYHELPDNYDPGHDALAAYLEDLAKKCGAVRLEENAREDILVYYISVPEGFDVTIVTQVYEGTRYYLLKFEYGELVESYTEEDLDEQELINYLNYLVDTYNEFRDEPRPKYSEKRTHIELYMVEVTHELLYTTTIDKTRHPDNYEEIISRTLALIGKPSDYLK